MPIDDNVARARRQASFVATLPNAAEAVEAHLLFVFTKGAGSNEMPEELQRFNSAERVESVRRAEERFEDAGVDYQLREDSGEVADDIIDEAEALDVDLIVLGGANGRPLARFSSARSHKRFSSRPTALSRSPAPRRSGKTVRDTSRFESVVESVVRSLAVGKKCRLPDLNSLACDGRSLLTSARETFLQLTRSVASLARCSQKMPPPRFERGTARSSVECSPRLS